MIVVPTDTPGYRIVRETPVLGINGGHYEVAYDDVRVPADNLLGPRGHGFVIAQDRLGPGRIFHCMRWLGQAQRAFELMCARLGTESPSASRSPRSSSCNSTSSTPTPRSSRPASSPSRPPSRSTRAAIALGRMHASRSAPSRSSAPACCTTSSTGPSRSTAPLTTDDTPLPHVPPRPRGPRLRRPGRGPHPEHRPPHPPRDGLTLRSLLGSRHEGKRLKITKLADGLMFPEGPTVLPNGDVLVVELHRGTLTRVRPDGTTSIAAETGGGPNGSALGPDGRVYIANSGGLNRFEVGGFVFAAASRTTTRAAASRPSTSPTARSRPSTPTACAAPTTSSSTPTAASTSPTTARATASPATRAASSTPNRTARPSK